MLEKIINFLHNNRLIKNLVLVFLIIFCFYSISQMQQDVFPQISPDVIMVSIIYPGAAAKDVELNGVIPIEKKLKQIAGIKDYISFAVESYGRIVIYLDQDYHDIKGLKDQIFRELNNVPDLSTEIEDVIIIDANPKLRAVYEIGINIKKGYNNTKKELFEFIYKFEKELLTIKGISSIDKEGYQDREIKIKINPTKLEYYYISLNEIVDSIKARNIRSTGGTLQSVIKDKSIVTIGEFQDPFEVKDVIIRSEFEGNRVYIKDIAKIEDGFKKSSVEVNVNGNNGITLKFIKDANADVVKTANNIKKYLKKVEFEIPEWVEISTTTDESTTIVTLLNNLKSNAIIGFIFIFIVIFIFLVDFKTALWTAFGISFSILMTLTVMNVLGYTLNIISLAALITVTGMLDDDAIVIAEIIYHYKKLGLSPLNAAIKGLNEVFAPVAISSFTTIVAFLPLLSIKGIMGKMIYIFPIVIGITLLVALLENSITLPLHLAYSNIMIKDKSNWFDMVSNFYEKVLKKLLKIRYLVLVFLICILGLVFFISKDRIKNFSLFISDKSADQIYILLEAPIGTNLKTTSGYVKKVEEAIKKELSDKILNNYKSVVGHHILNGLTQRGYHENWAMITLNLVSIDDRKEDADIIINRLKTKINTGTNKDFNKIYFQKKAVNMGSVGDPVNIRLIGNNLENSIKAMNDIKNYLATITGVYDIDDDQKKGMDEIKMNFDYKKMSRLGITVSNVANTIKTAYEGVIATKINTIDETIDFRVQIDENFQNNTNFLLNLLIPNKKGNLVRLKDIAYLTIQSSESMINHYNGDKVINITANIEENKNTSLKISKQILNKFSSLYLETKILVGGEGKETMDVIGGLIVSFFFALLLVYFLLVVLYKNFALPFLVFIEIPFAIMGGIIGLMIHDMNLTLLSVIGLIGLCGLAVNDNVIMIDFINETVMNNDGKKSLIDLVAYGAKRRLRPVILTTATTIAGFIPTIYGIGGSGGLVVPIAIALGYGLIFDSLITIIFIPLLYMIYLDIKNIKNKIKNIFNHK